MTLSLFLVEHISVTDVLIGTLRLALSILKKILPWEVYLVEKEQETIEDNKAPPALSLFVGEEVQTKEGLG